MMATHGQEHAWISTNDPVPGMNRKGGSRGRTRGCCCMGKNTQRSRRAPWSMSRTSFSRVDRRAAGGVDLVRDCASGAVLEASEWLSVLLTSFGNYRLSLVSPLESCVSRRCGGSASHAREHAHALASQTAS